MSQANQCPECGRDLPASSPRGLCPACLLQRGLETNTAGYSAADAAPASQRWSPPAPEELAQRFPDLDGLELIGRGGMGAVYKGRQKSLDRLVALKILPPEIGRDPTAGGFAARFTREAQAMARLSHPNIVAIHDFGQRGGRTEAKPQGAEEPPLFYFLMEYIDGLNLRQLLDSGHMRPKEALAIVPQICEALQYAHDRGIVHRDIKPENILLNRQGQVKIADFGLAKLVAPGSQPPLPLGGGRGEGAPIQPGVTESAMGTPQYMSPEQAEHPQAVDHRADIYSLGVVFYQMLTGELPQGAIEPPSKKVVIDVRLDEVVLRALEREPDRRYQQASQIKTEVEMIVSTPDSQTRTADGAAEKEGAPAALPPASASTPWRGDWLLVRVFTWAFYLAAPLMALLPFFALGIDPGDRGHLERFLGCWLLAAIIAAVGYFIGLLGRVLIKLLGVPLPEQATTGKPRPYRIAFIALLLVAGTYLTGRGIHAYLGQPDVDWHATAALLPPQPLTPSTQPVAATSPFAAPVIESTTGERWQAELPGGVTVELVGISENPSQEKRWWRPDGTLLPSPPEHAPPAEEARDLAPPGNDLMIVVMDIPFPREPGDFEMVTRMRRDEANAAMPPEDVRIDYEGWTWTKTVLPPVDTADGLRVTDVYVLSQNFPKSQDRLTIRVGLAVGPWETVATGKTDGENRASSFRGLRGGKLDVSFGSPFEAEIPHPWADKPKVTTAHVTVAHNLPADQQARVIAILTDGSQPGADRAPEQSNGGVKQITQSFRRRQSVDAKDMVSIKDIKEIRLESRPYQWVEFKNIPLRPRAAEVSATQPTEAASGAHLATSSVWRRCTWPVAHRSKPWFRPSNSRMFPWP
ncbi:MAG: serine/threonine-protein kinase [Phycisphaeraceae bacterium]